jgi:F-type H+-transporting ATPase subunit b
MGLLYNTTFLVALSLALFLGVLYYFKVHVRIAAMLDARADRIRRDLEEARRLREEAQSLLASFERRQKEVQQLSEDIVARAEEDAKAAMAAGKAELEKTVARRLRAAEDQIASAEAAAVRQVRDRAIQVAMAAAAEVMQQNMTVERSRDLIERAIGETAGKLN